MRKTENEAELKAAFCAWCVENLQLPYCEPEERAELCPFRRDKPPWERLDGNMRRCPCCGKEFFISYEPVWAYKYRENRRGKATVTIYFCSWHCLREDERNRCGGKEAGYGISA